MTETTDLLTAYDTIAKLAAVYRHNSLPFDKDRRENVAEHSYSLAVLAAALAHEINTKTAEPLDIGMVTQFAVVHDLVEAYMDEGDISVFAPKEVLNAKQAAEERALEKVRAHTAAFPWISRTIATYEARQSKEANFVYALDKLVVHMNVILSDHHHARPSFAAYLETETVARQKIEMSYPDLLPSFTALCRIFRTKPHFFSDELDVELETAKVAPTHKKS